MPYTKHIKEINEAKSRDEVKLICDTCNGVFLRLKRNMQAFLQKGNTGCYCSRTCQTEKQTTSRQVACNSCGEKFYKSLGQLKKYPNSFCSSSCSASFNNRGLTRNPKTPKICRKCSKSFMIQRGVTSTILCESCYQNYSTLRSLLQSLTVEEYQNRKSVRHKHPSWRSSHIRRFNRSWNKELLSYGCQKCDYDEHVELAHIKSVSSFSSSATLGEINHPDNILVLCPNHHWEFDHGLLKFENIPGRK